MAEAAFATTFLSTLDSRPIKLSADHVEDAKSFPARPPYILPRMPTSMSKPKTLLPGQERSLTVTLKSLRNPPLDIKLTSQPLNTSILDIKTTVSEQTGIPIDKMKILHNKRPLTDSKILKDVASESDLRLEFSVMVIGGAAAIQPERKEEAVAWASGLDALTTDAFWADLNGFLEQRLIDKVVAGELGQLFKTSWDSSRSGP
ncbi:ubiquitin supergroup [Pochonia chlamydosporia 170]|uniref:Ubiquitin supergroup n=1 Tax=Pochonia chlamydosporia 170 TaxID=1380566 RepID=A0A179G6U4_METCM|nr:ubiquitin supergroup [Pochonia chlamydosporia 170]OAQ72899.1 ubiquitin supergroup [Pochonia chlamydosporia 170]